MTEMTLLPIAELDAATLDRVAVAHRVALPTGLAELGLPAVRRFYAARDGAVFGFVACAGASVLGAVAGSAEPGRAFDAVPGPLPQFMLHMVRHNPSALPQMVWSKLRPAHDAARPEASADLMYIFAASAARGRGVGRALVEGFVAESGRRGLRTVTLSVETDNASAIRLYDKLGFVQTSGPRQEGRHARLRMAISTSADA